MEQVLQVTPQSSVSKSNDESESKSLEVVEELYDDITPREDLMTPDPFNIDKW